MKPPPRQTISEWADENRRLSPESSAEPGRWETRRAEYQRGIMDAVSDPAVHTVVGMTAAQVGKTELLNNLVGFHVDRDPSPILVLQPTLDMAKTWSKDRLAPMLRDTPCLRGKVKDARSRDSDNTVLHKVFPGGHITIAGANSAASLASRPIRIVICDEVDRYPVSAGTEGDPVNLAKKRSTTFWNRKLVLMSTPTIKGASRIEGAYEASDRRHYFVPCQACGVFQTLRWRQVRWPEGDPEGAGYACEACGAVWDEGMRLRAVAMGEWRATAPFRGVAGFWLNALYSPWVRLGELAVEFVEVKGFPEQLKTFVNTSLGESWEDRGEQVDDTGLLERQEPYGPELPAGVALVTAGVDVQDDRLEVELVGWGRGEECWSLDYRVVRGDPSTAELWNRLDDVLRAPLMREDGARLGVAAVSVDTGGHHTHAAYRFCKEREARRIWAIKGVAGAGKPIWPRRPSKKNVGRVNLYLIGVDAAKDWVFARLKIPEPGPGYCHFPNRYDEEYFRQLTGEKVITRYVKGFPTRVWVKKRARNDALDARVYAVSALTGLLTMGIDIDREADKADTMARSIAVGAEPPQVTAMRRRVRSRGIASAL